MYIPASFSNIYKMYDILTIIKSLILTCTYYLDLVWEITSTQFFKLSQTKSSAPCSNQKCMTHLCTNSIIVSLCLGLSNLQLVFV